MKSHTHYLWFATERRQEIIDITDQVVAQLEHSGITEGLVLVSAMHITASVFVNDHESGLWQDILRWLVAGLTNRAIARELKISENTVKNYLFRIFNKLGVSSRVEVVLYAASQRWALEPYPRDVVRPAPNRISRPL